MLHFYIDDDRYRVPTLIFVETRRADRARELALEMMGRSPHYRGIEVCNVSGRLFGVGSCADKSMTGPPPVLRQADRRAQSVSA